MEYLQQLGWRCSHSCSDYRTRWLCHSDIWCHCLFPDGWLQWLDLRRTGISVSNGGRAVSLNEQNLEDGDDLMLMKVSLDLYIGSCQTLSRLGKSYYLIP